MINLKKHPIRFYQIDNDGDNYLYFAYGRKCYDWASNRPDRDGISITEITKEDMMQSGIQRITNLADFYSLNAIQFAVAKYLLNHPDILNDPLWTGADVELPSLEK